MIIKSYYDKAAKEAAKEFGYNSNTLERDINWDQSKITPEKIDEYCTKMFFMGVEATIQKLKGLKKKL